MNAIKQLIEIGCLVQRVNDIRDDLAFGLHSMEFSDIEAVQKYAVDRGIAKAAAAGDFEPAPGAIAAAETATAGERRTILRGDLFQMRANGADVSGVNQCVKSAPDKFIRAVAQTRLESGIRKLQGAVRGENGDDFPGRVQQRRKLGGPESETGVRENSLGHLIVASFAGWSRELPARFAEASKDRPTNRKR